MQQLMFKLDQNPNGRGLRCGGDGLFFANDALLQRDAEGNFEARSDIELKKSFDCACSDETRLESYIRSVKLVAAALNKGDMARAMMTAVLMRLPDPNSSILFADANGALAKAGYDPNEPRDEHGQWTNGGDESTAAISPHRDPRIQLADDGWSDAPNDAVAEAVARAAAAQRNRKPSSSSEKADGPDEQESLWQTLRSKLPAEAHSLLSAILRAQADESQNDLAAAQAESKTIADTLKAYADYLAQPVLDEDGRPVQIYSFPMVNSSAPFFNPGLNLVAPNAPVTRPATNADRINALIGLASLGAMAIGPTLRLAGPAAEFAGSGATVAADVSRAADVTVGTAADSVWTLPPIQRGISIEQRLAVTEYADWYHVGQEANGYFPLVDFQQGDTLVSLRTANTTGINWFDRAWDHIVDLGKNGAEVDGNRANMILDLRVQPGGLEDAEPLVKLGQKYGVTVRIKEFR